MATQNPNFVVVVVLVLLILPSVISTCSTGCNLAVASYRIANNENMTYITSLFDLPLTAFPNPYNPQLNNNDLITAGSTLNLTFTCSCLTPTTGGGSSFLGHVFNYKFLSGNTYATVASSVYKNLTTVALFEAMNSYPATNVPLGATVNVTVPCSCGNAAVLEEYGLFVTYPLQPGDNLTTVGDDFNFSSPSELKLLQAYNPGVDFSAANSTVFVPFYDPETSSYDPLTRSGKGISGGAIAGIVIGAAFLITLGIYLYVYKRRKEKNALLLPSNEDDSIQLGTSTSMDKISSLAPRAGSASSVPGITIDKSVEFSYEELSSATNGFSMANKIGQGGFGAVYYAELRGEKTAIKKMDMQASQEFLAELKVLTHVHHLNLVRLIGYCIEGSLFLVYEFIENGNLSQHLRGSGHEPLSWGARVQIALDSARGLEYIHEHTVPVYIHRDIKSANILIDKNCRAKVADFGLTKLTQVGSVSLPTRVVGTFGYMPPEYARYGDVSPKVDVYAFGVVLYELISAKEAIVRSTESSSDSTGLVYLFEDAFTHSDAKEALQKLVDPRLGDDYPFDAILRMAQLARACTKEDAKDRPTMRSVVVNLMSLSSTTEFWDMNSYENQVNLMSGR